MKYFINPKRPDGTHKSRKEIDNETNLLLHSYRRHNLLLNDRMFDITNNVLPEKDKIIENLRDQVKKLAEELKNKSPWII